MVLDLKFQIPQLLQLFEQPLLLLYLVLLLVGDILVKFDHISDFLFDQSLDLVLKLKHLIFLLLDAVHSFLAILLSLFAPLFSPSLFGFHFFLVLHLELLEACASQSGGIWQALHSLAERADGTGLVESAYCGVGALRDLLELLEHGGEKFWVGDVVLRFF